ncbi:hypothetical protein RR48_11320 [Papilio machaon]|uniref:Uncharacterized protein n=1 Tax=Papilio machaon TaxID=76193 RepID=A0A194QTE8_PAPMA|nr:hypothetical protein RR48_11320 [Papilio machaon]
MCPDVPRCVPIGPDVPRPVSGQDFSNFDFRPRFVYNITRARSLLRRHVKSSRAREIYVWQHHGGATLPLLHATHTKIITGVVADSNAAMRQCGNAGRSSQWTF